MLLRFFKNLWGRKSPNRFLSTPAKSDDLEQWIRKALPTAHPNRRDIFRALTSCMLWRIGNQIRGRPTPPWVVLLGNTLLGWFLAFSLVGFFDAVFGLIGGFVCGLITLIPLDRYTYCYGKKTGVERHAVFCDFLLKSFLIAITGFWFGWPLIWPLIFPLLFAVGWWITETTVAHIRQSRKTPANTEGFSPSNQKSRLILYFQTLIESHRGRILGDQSEFNRLRVRLEQLREQTKTEREIQENKHHAENPITIDRLRLLDEIEEDLKGALASLAQQKEYVLNFFRTCEAQLARIDMSMNEFLADQRLQKLSREAEELTRKTRSLALSIAASFMEDAAHLQSALERLHEKIVFSVPYEIEDVPAIATEIANFELENIAALQELEQGLVREAIPALN